MATADIITEDLVRSLAPNPAAFSNGRQISQKGEFTELCITQDKTLIFGKCKGSGKNPYDTSADFSSGEPVFRCSCPSRQFPCKHSLAIMFAWLSDKKKFKTADIPEDIAAKREKAQKRAEKSASAEKDKKPAKPNKAAAAKKLKKQAEGLDLCEQFVSDMLTRGVSSVNKAASAQYKDLAKQLGDYYLPEPQAIMNEIVTAAQELSDSPSDAETNRLTALCVRLYSTVKKSRAYISQKLESGEVLPEDSILYEAMGGIWKLSQLKELGLYKENARILQLSFTVIHDDMHKADIDTAYWIDLDSGEISRTENIRPLKAAKYIKAQDSVFGVHKIPELYRYPGGINRRIRWENAEISDANESIFSLVISKAQTSISETVKAAKNELKSTLSEPSAAFLIAFDSIEFSVEDGHPVLKLGEEKIELRSNENYPYTADVLKTANADMLKNGALLGEFYYISEEQRFCVNPVTIISNSGTMRLC